jgi:lipopolysaccharide biosynthesis glycosyltransferase
MKPRKEISSKPAVLLVTITIGEKYQKEYEKVFEDNHKAYADRHGYDFKRINNFIESEISGGHQDTISFQKLIVCDYPFEKQYDKIIFIDSDILIHHFAGPIHEVDTQEKIGIVDEFQQPSFEERIRIQRRYGWNPSATHYYQSAAQDYIITTNSLLNSGVMILIPEIHREIMRNIYLENVKKAIGHPMHFHFEQATLGYFLQKDHLYTLIDNRWNAIWIINAYSWESRQGWLRFYRNNYFIHFAGTIGQTLIPRIKTYAKIAAWMGIR